MGLPIPKQQTNKTQDNLSLFCFPDIIPYLYPIQPLFDPKKYKKKIHSPLFKKKKKKICSVQVPHPPNGDFCCCCCCLNSHSVN